jgi:glycosyltransferase involved in cell wall biosynthesis
LAERLKELGHHVEVLTALPNYPTGRVFEGYPRYYNKEDRGGISVHRSWIVPSNRQSLGSRLVSYLSFCLSSYLVGLTRISHPDVIITESPPLFLAAIGWLLAVVKGARWILNVSDLWPDSAKYIGMMREQSSAYRILRWVAHFLYRRAWLVTGQSTEIIGEIQRAAPSTRLYHLSNGVDLMSFKPEYGQDRIRKRYLGDGEVAFVYAGLHGLFQGLDQILEAAQRLRRKQVRFVLIGDGPEKEALVRKAQGRSLENVDFYPPMAHRDIPSTLASMDVAVITLRSPIRGAVPSKIYEAMASGIPILLVAEGEASSIVQTAGAGLTVSPGDIEGLVLSISKLASEPDLRSEMGRAGRLAAQSLYDRAMIVKRFNTMLAESQGERYSPVYHAIHGEKRPPIAEETSTTPDDGL